MYHDEERQIYDVQHGLYISTSIIVQQPKAIFWAKPVSSDKVCFSVEKFKMATNVTENQPIFQK